MREIQILEPSDVETDPSTPQDEILALSFPRTSRILYDIGERSSGDFNVYLGDLTPDLDFCYASGGGTVLSTAQSCGWF